MALDRSLGLRLGGSYAWLRAPLSKRAVEDRRQGRPSADVLGESGKVYGYRDKLGSMPAFFSSLISNRSAAFVSRQAQQVRRNHRDGS